MKYYLTCLFVLCTFLGYSQDSVRLIKPTVWVKADFAGNDSLIWYDISGNGHHFKPMPGHNLPPKGVVNFNPGFGFNDQSGPLWSSYNFNDKTRLTMVLVYQSEDTLHETGIWTVHKGKSPPMSLTSQKFSSEAFKITYCDSNVLQPVVNTMSSAWFRLKNDTSTHDTIYIGATDSISYKGIISECLVFHDYLPQKDLQRIQSYLCIKYGVTMDNLSYMDSGKHIIWDRMANSSYSQSIAGLGRDTIFGLNQKQSCSTSARDILTMGAQSICQNNQTNPCQIQHGDYIIWGNNGQSITMTEVDSSNSLKKLDRIWKVQTTGNTVSSIPTFLKFDMAGIQYDSNQVWLVIDRNGFGEPALTNAEYFQPDSIHQGFAFFSNIYWDTDHNHRDLFTLLTEKETLSTFLNRSVVNMQQEVRENKYIQTKEPASTSDDIRIYPNPTAGGFNITTKTDCGQQAEVTIYNIQGQSIYSFQDKGTKTNQFSGFIKVPGTYFIDIRCGGYHYYEKLIVH